VHSHAVPCRISSLHFLAPPSTSPFFLPAFNRGDNPIFYLVKGFGAVILITVAFYWAEVFWLKDSLSLASIGDPEIAKRMYPLF